MSSLPIAQRQASPGFAPTGGASGPPAAQRQGLRSSAAFFGCPLADGPTRVVKVDPPDGSIAVFRDALVMVRLSAPVDPASVSLETLWVEADEHTLPACLSLSPDGHVLLWSAERPLAPGVEHRVLACGLQDLRGREVAPHESRFVPCDLVREDLSE